MPLARSDWTTSLPSSYTREKRKRTEARTYALIRIQSADDHLAHGESCLPCIRDHFHRALRLGDNFFGGPVPERLCSDSRAWCGPPLVAMEFFLFRFDESQPLKQI